ncbi:MAG: hypothetical protein WBK55_08340 [Alphaproteobacteria bacterium]
MPEIWIWVLVAVIIFVLDLALVSRIVRDEDMVGLACFIFLQILVFAVCVIVRLAWLMIADVF